MGPKAARVPGERKTQFCKRPVRGTLPLLTLCLPSARRIKPGLTFSLRSKPVFRAAPGCPFSLSNPGAALSFAELLHDPDASEGYGQSHCKAVTPGSHNLTILIGAPSPKAAPSSGLQRINVEERRLSPGLSISLSIRIRSTSHRHNGEAGEQQNSVGGPLFDNLSKTASSIAREASPRSAAGSRRILDPDLAPIARPLGGDLEAGLGCNAIGLQPPGQSISHPAHALRRPVHRNDSLSFRNPCHAPHARRSSAARALLTKSLRLLPGSPHSIGLHKLIFSASHGQLGIVGLPLS
jgi:hypothetical protein